MPQPWLNIAMSIMVVREFAVAAIRQIAASKGTIVAADKLGKAKTLFQDIALSFGLMLPVFFNTNISLFFNIVCYALFIIATLLTVISGVNYIVKNKSVLMQND